MEDVKKRTISEILTNLGFVIDENGIADLLAKGIGAATSTLITFKTAWYYKNKTKNLKQDEEEAKAYANQIYKDFLWLKENEGRKATELYWENLTIFKFHAVKARLSYLQREKKINRKKLMGKATRTFL